jgi:SAM-dependent methyltransferase
MNNRQRLIASLIKQELLNCAYKNIYFMEQVTPIFSWAEKLFTEHHLVGSEYLGHEYAGGTILSGVRHEDVEDMSFDDESFDLIVSNDVFEHVPNPSLAFSECARVLRAGGVMLATIPFHSDLDASVVRARLIDNKVENLLPPSFHGNPISADGSLVFTDFGWDVIASIKNAGFANVFVELYASSTHAHIGEPQLVLRAYKD